MFRGEYPADVLDGLGPHMPDGFERDFPVISTPVDWLGINYYTRKLIAADPGAMWPATREVEGPLPKTQVGWEIYPQGLHHFITWAHENYTRGLPIHVTENGMASADQVEGAGVSDPDRIAYLDQHLGEVRRAIADGAPVESYFIWSLLDNYEWSQGYEKRFGLVHVDFDTLKRTPKSSMLALGEALAS